ncbi:2-methylcitrate dehydratase [Mycolicibacterium chitae]|uniref:MmgE/PrpD family protein n=1 Tax=Mycolicibacterium chitae TaxID=1792 RepID=A0A448ID96_MYCCI|nr:MmgE/PrpD family protein [Mycolicibacterium chitae]MCV7108304.1 MmgE/PrpD family protein [Mycolicibacterium chitae]BBZ01431.1 2-methylcitrate dehydratase [Mycolicibacterium chitae]VEG50267.1 MmgE/PrpD family protein [Mycolicibacterium chitae]
MVAEISAQTRRLAEFLSAAASTPLPPEVLHKTKHHVIDTIAAMVSGAELPPGKRGLAYVADVADGASVLIGGGRAAPVEAALANGMSAHADETDDSHARSISHPGCAVVPAALAVGDLRRSSGEQVLRAVAAGYDVGTRVVLSLGKPVLNTDSSGRSTHAYCGLFGAAATASTLYGFTEEQARHALSYAAQSASGVTSWVRDPNHVEKAFVFAGMPASNGVRAAAMVASGCDGVDDVFSGVPNFLDALSAEVRRDELADGLGERYEIMHTNIKKFAVGSPAQAAVQAMLELVEEEPIDPAQVANIRIVLPHDLCRVVDNRSMPDICCQYLVAGTLVDRAFTFAMAHDDDRMTDPVITALRQRTDLVPDPEKAGVRTADVTVTLADGRTRQRYIGAVRGTVDDPMTDDEVTAKAVDLMEPVLDAAATGELMERLWSLEGCADIGEITGRLTAGALAEARR